MPFIWRVGAIHAVAIELSGLHPLQIAMPDLIGSMRQADALRLMPARGLEQAEIDGTRMGRKQREIHAAAVPRRAEWIGLAVLETDHRPASPLGVTGGQSKFISPP